MKNETINNNYRGVLIAIVLALLWIIVTAILGIRGYFEYKREAFHLMIIVTVATPTVIFGLLFTLFSSFRKWTQSLNIAMLTLPHAWRTIGYLFLVQWYYNLLPAGFAAPAGYGDFIVGIAAPFIAVFVWLQWKYAIRYAVIFHVFGTIDLILAIVTGTSAFDVLPENLHIIDPLTAFPTVIIPVSFVPLLLMSHIMVFTKVIMDKKENNTNKNN